MKNSGPGSQPVHSPDAIPGQARLQSSPVASDPIPKGHKVCVQCGEVFKFNGGNQKRCLTCNPPRPKRTGLPDHMKPKWIPDGMTAEQLHEILDEAGIDYRAYAQRRSRYGYTHEQAIIPREPRKIDRETLYPPTPEQVLANRWLRKSFFKHAVFSAAGATRYPTCGSGEIVQSAPPAAALAQI